MPGSNSLGLKKPLLTPMPLNSPPLIVASLIKFIDTAFLHTSISVPISKAGTSRTVITLLSVLTQPFALFHV